MTLMRRYRILSGLARRRSELAVRYACFSLARRESRKTFRNRKRGLFGLGQYALVKRGKRLGDADQDHPGQAEIGANTGGNHRESAHDKSPSNTAIELPHILELERLPLSHKDPFDRLLIAQAIFQDWDLVSSDSQFARYPIRSPSV